MPIYCIEKSQQIQILFGRKGENSIAPKLSGNNLHNWKYNIS